MNELPPFDQIQSSIARHPIAVQVENQLKGCDLQAKRFLVAFSGGLDSTALIVILWSLGLPVEAAHINYKLRAAESDLDAAFCKQLCDKLNIHLHFKTVDSKKEMATTSTSLQSFARDVRYSFFEEICKGTSNTILTAHHLDDSIESFFINVLRGTGIDGLGGIPSQRDNVQRPMSGLRKEEILAFLNVFSIPFRTDSSNDKNDYLRNKIRNILIPVISEIQPSYHAILKANMQRIQAVSGFLSDEINSWKGKNLVVEGEIWKMKRSGFKKNVQEAFIYRVFKEFAVRWSEVKKLKRAILGESGKKFESRTHIILVDRSHIIITRKKVQEEFESIEIKESDLHPSAKYLLPSGHILITRHPAQVHPVVTQVDSFLLHKSQLQFPLTIRRWKAGDRFKPSGMKGQHQKISAFLSNQKLNRIERKKVLVLTDSSKILWVIGMRKSHTEVASSDEMEVVNFTLFRKG